MGCIILLTSHQHPIKKHTMKIVECFNFAPKNRAQDISWISFWDSSSQCNVDCSDIMLDSSCINCAISETLPILFFFTVHLCHICFMLLLNIPCIFILCSWKFNKEHICILITLTFFCEIGIILWRSLCGALMFYPCLFYPSDHVWRSRRADAPRCAHFSIDFTPWISQQISV